MDLLSILIVAVIVVWFAAAVRYIWKNKGGCSCSQRASGAGCSGCSGSGCHSCCHCETGGGCGCCTEKKKQTFWRQFLKRK